MEQFPHLFSYWALALGPKDQTVLFEANLADLAEIDIAQFAPNPLLFVPDVHAMNRRRGYW